MNHQKKIRVLSKRIGNVIGEHILEYSSTEDTIIFKHAAHNRDGFAKGAILAAEFVKNKKGLFSMNDLINTF